MGSFEDRLNAIYDRITSKEFLNNAGLGNEIGFHIFSYPPEKELDVRKHIEFILKQIKKRRSGLKAKHINIFKLIIDYLKNRNLLDRALKIDKEKGEDALLKALKAPLDGNKIADIFVKKADPQNHDIVLVSGIGNAWPLLRSHNLLNNLHPRMGDTPLIIFYPGIFTGQELRLFGRIKSNYYRAFQLVP